MSFVKSAVKKIGDVGSLRGLYLLLRMANSAVRDRLMAGAIARGRFNRGFCPTCGKKTVFVERNDWLRDNYFCIDCFSIPRQRAIMHVLEKEFPAWRELTIHESSAGGQSSDKIAAECLGYTSSHFLPGVTPGETHEGVRCENLEAMTFADDSFDLFVTQDVFEHVLDPGSAFREVARVLRPGGSHVFTIPLYPHEKSLVRSVKGEDGAIVNVEPADYHGDPREGAGWLVATEWGEDFTKFIEDSSSLKTDVFSFKDPKLGLLGEFPEVFVSTKAK